MKERAIFSAACLVGIGLLVWGIIGPDKRQPVQDGLQPKGGGTTDAAGRRVAGTSQAKPKTTTPFSGARDQKAPQQQDPNSDWENWIEQGVQQAFGELPPGGGVLK